MAVSGTGVSIGSKTVRVLQVKRDKAGAWAVEKAMIQPIEGNAAAAARAAITSAQAKGKALVGLSGRDLIIRYTQVPPVPDWRLEVLMDFEIQEVSEQSGGDVSAAYTLLDVDDTASGDNVVLVALAKNGYLNPRLAALEGAGLSVLGGAPRALGAFWAYKENGHLRFDETVVILHIGHENCDIAVARNGHLLFARNVSGGSKMFTDVIAQNMGVNEATAEKVKVRKGNITPRGKARYRDSNEEKVANNLLSAAGHFVSAINSTVMFAKAQTKVPEVRPDRVVVMGGGALLRGMSDYLESNLGMPVELFDPLDDLDLSALSSEVADSLRQQQGAIAVTLGLAQMAADEASTRVEVLPPEKRKQRKFVRETVPVIVGAAVLLVAVIVAFVASSAAAGTAAEEVARLQEVSERYRSNEQEYKKASEVVSDLNVENSRLRRLASQGPAAQEAMDLVQRVLNEGDGFQEIFISKFSAAPRTVQVVDDEGVQVPKEVPAAEFHAEIKSVGDRPVAAAFTSFLAALQQAIAAGHGHLEFKEMGGLDAKANFFKFRIEQAQFPEKYEAPSPEGGEGASE